MTSTLPQWLAGRTESDLAEIVQRRPDVIHPYPPDDLDDLAERLHYPQSLRSVLYDMPQPCLELLETLLVFGSGGMTRSALAAILHRNSAAQRRELDDVLHTCEMWAIAWEIDGKIWIPGALRSLMPMPLGLGAPVADLLSPRTVDDLRSRAYALGLSPANRKASILAAIEEFYADGDAIRAIAAEAPADQRERLTVAAWTNPVLRADSTYYFPHRPDPATAWLLEHGLVVTDWQRVIVPREVGVAIRGADWHPTLTPQPPDVPSIAVGVEVVDRDAGAAANTAIEQFTAVVDACGATPVALLKTGGVGVREIRRLAKATQIPESATRMWLEMAYAGDLLDVDDDEIVPTPAFDAWLALPPAERLVLLLSIWSDLRTVPLLETRPEGVVTVAAMTPDSYGSIASELRLDVLRIATTLPAGTAVAGVATTALQATVTWHRPIISRLLSDVSLAIGPLWAEARLLGLVGQDAASSLGRTVLTATSAEEMSAAAAKFVHDLTAEAIFQADLTIVVPGAPTSSLAHLLDAVADRESRGAAGTWRCSPASVRRALDTGHTAEELAESLRAIAVGGALPQPLEYLIADVARRHGTLRVRSAGCVLRADDPALIAEIASTKSLSALSLSIVARTVLVSALPVDRTLAALRSAGFAPVGESADGVPLIERRAPRRAAARADVLPFTPEDLVDDGSDYAVVRQLRRPGHSEMVEEDDFDDDMGDDDDLALLRAKALNLLPRVATPTADGQQVGRERRHLSAVPPTSEASTSSLDTVRRSALQLRAEEKRILADAIDNEIEIKIGYMSNDGRATNRIIRPLELNGNLLVAWCHLRDDERAFSLSGITAVTRV